MKKVLSLVLALTLCFNLTLSVSASNSDPTLKQIEDQLLSYLSETHPAVLTNTETYLTFLLDQLMAGTDGTLSAAENYEDISLYMSEYVRQMQSIPLSEGENVLLKLPDAAALLTTSEMRQIIAERNTRTASSQTQARATSSYDYDVDAAVAYALQWAESRNPIYNSHIGDCTNFVSQCIVAGGVAMEKPSGMLQTGIYDTSDYWYSIRYEEWHTNSYVYRWYETSSFVNVDKLYDWISSYSIVYSPSVEAVQDCSKIGDIVQLRTADGNWYHSIIITGGTYGARTYCAHTKDRNNFPINEETFSDVAEFRIIHMS